MPVGGEAAQTGLHLSNPGTGANLITLPGHRSGVPDVSLTIPPAGVFASREEVKKQRELEEARKSGLIPAEKDEEGKDINPHIPQYIAKAPWYLSQDNRPSLKHQRYAADSGNHHISSLNNWYKRGVIEQTAKQLKFRKGACTNCGAMTHQFKECTDRPRQKGAQWTGRDIQPDELIVADSSELLLDFDGKRDPYGGYDPATYRSVIRDFTLADIERKRRKAVELQETVSCVPQSGKKNQESNIEENTHNSVTVPVTSEQYDGPISDSGSDESDLESLHNDDDDDVKVKEFDQTNAPVGMKDDRTRTTTMNLRIREDTAKYLFNLDVNSAFYDPKTRSMRENPMKHLKETEQGIYRGDNAMRNTAEAECVQKMEIFSWEAYKHNVTVHAQAQPTQLELMHKEFHRKQQSLVELKKQHLLEKYGGAEHLNPSQALLHSQTEIYQEYNPTDGSVKKTKDRIMAKSKYQDDALFGDHTEVWGSWYNTTTGKWGYCCCRQMDKANPNCCREANIIT